MPSPVLSTVDKPVTKNKKNKKPLCPNGACLLSERDGPQTKQINYMACLMLINAMKRKKNGASQERLELLMGYEGAQCGPHGEGDICSRAVGSQPSGSLPGEEHSRKRE